MRPPEISRSMLMTRCLIALLVLGVSACSSMRTVDVGKAVRQGAPPGVYEGSLVDVKTLGGERLRFRVTNIEPEGIGGDPGFIAYANMRSLKVEDPNRYDEVGSWVLGLLGVAALVVLIANADSVNACSGDCPAPER